MDHLQGELVRQHQDSSSNAEQIEKSINSLKTKLETNSSSTKTPGSILRGFSSIKYILLFLLETALSSSGISDMMKSIQAAVGNLETNSKH